MCDIAYNLFLNTTSKYATAILAEDNCKVKISNSKFRNLFANKTAGAISIKNTPTLIISDCEFYNVSSVNNAGAIFVDTSAEEEKNNKA